MKKRTVLHKCLRIVFLFTLSSCLHSYGQEHKVHVRISKDIEALHPLITTNLTENSISRHIFYPLIDIEPKTQMYVPILLKAMPAIAEGGKVKIYEIRENATWSDGKPVTAYDVIFTFKAVLCPNLNTFRWKENIKSIQDIEIDINNPKIFKIRAGAPNFTVTSLPIYPEHVYDKSNILRNYSFNQLLKMKAKNSPSDVQKFEEQFSSVETKKIALGSGPYKVKEWVSKNILVLEKQYGWWGDGLDNSKELFDPNAREIHYEIMSDLAMTTVAFKLQQLDVWYDIPAKEFNDLQKLDSNYYHFALRKVPTLSFEYIAINNKPNDPHKIFLSDSKVRKALSYAINVEDIQQKVLKGYGNRISCPCVPQKKTGYSKEIPISEHNSQEAKKLLGLAGWIDSNNDDILDQMIDGKLVNLKLSLLVNKEDSYDRKIAHYIIKDLQSIGIEVEVEEVDSETEHIKLQDKNYDLAIVSYQDKLGPVSPKILWHTKSTQNITGFGNEELDALIEKIDKEKDITEKEKLYSSFNKTWIQEQPAILLWQKEMLIAVREKYKNYKFTMAFDNYVGFNLGSFYLSGEAKR